MTRSVAENWKESKDSNIKPLTLSKYWGIIENYLMPKLADYPIIKSFHSEIMR